MAALAAADFAVEAVPEQIALKRAVLAEAGEFLSPEAILASNTSSISVTTLAAATRRPGRFLGMHFMNPVPVMPLVGVIRALQTTDDVFAVTMRLCEKIGKNPVAVNDSPGFVSNRVLMPLINEAAVCVMEGVATAESVDVVMKLGMNHPMGPLELADSRIGLDVLSRCLRSPAARFGRSEVPSLPRCCARWSLRAGFRPQIRPRLLPILPDPPPLPSEENGSWRSQGRIPVPPGRF